MTDTLNSAHYGFTSHWFNTPSGNIAYLDEGRGDPIVFVHGNPGWSFEFRNVIPRLSANFRCIAPDHLGFGRSDKPGAAWDHLPSSHAQNLEALLLSLDLHNITLVVGDWGGPIGLRFATRHPQRIKALVITNTWCWPVNDDWYYRAFSAFMGGPLGHFLSWRFNFFARTVVRLAFGDKRLLTHEVHQGYKQHLGKGIQRKGSWVFPRQIIASSPWLAEIEADLARLVSARVAICWGQKDIAFRAKQLKRWQEIFHQAKLTLLPDTGHFVAEEKPDVLAHVIRELIGATVMA